MSTTTDAPEDFGKTAEQALLTSLNFTERTKGRQTQFTKAALKVTEALQAALFVDRVLSGKNWCDEGVVEKLMQRINDALALCPLQYYVDFSAEGDGLATFEHLRSDHKNVQQAAAIFGIVHLIRTSRLDYLKRCDCSTWFIADRVTQMCCSRGCYRRAYQRTEEFKVQRRKYYADVIVGGKAIIKEQKKGSNRVKAAK